MNHTHSKWPMPVAGVLLAAAAASASQDLPDYFNSTNRLTVSFRYGLNIKGRFHEPATLNFPVSLPVAGGRHTPNGDPYNYDNGYVLTDISGNAGNQSWYWGYDSASQVDAANNTISFQRTTVPGAMPGGHDISDDSGRYGVEVAYNRELLRKEDWHDLRFGVEAAINFMPINFSGGTVNSVSLTRTTDTYSYTPGTTPPGYLDPGELPYQGTFQGPGFLINVPSVSSAASLVPGSTFMVQQKFDGNLWGVRLGPYLEMPVTERLSLYLSGGLAAGLMDASVSWNESLTLPNGGPTLSQKGSGDNADLLWGAYVGLQAQYQFSDRWTAELGVQFQDLGTYSHDFGAGTAEVDLRNSIFIQAGLSFSF